MEVQLAARCAEILYQEAACIDERRWPEWLSLYTEDAEFWMPAWTMDGRATDDPQNQLSLIYYNNRGGLEDRVWRIESGVSPASSPAVRTCHLITNVRASETAGAELRVASNWQVHIYRPERQETLTYFGFYQHTLRSVEGGLKIARKKIILLNDLIDGVLDIYHV
jgi:3-phenylpropionate/cinnamic acid dioxygenase small subunit